MTGAPQGTPEWFADRLGKVGASRVADVIARTKSGWGASRANYMAELIAERLTGVAADRYTNTAMQWGTDNEGEARTAYEFMGGVPVVQVGFVQHPTIPMSGASPDGLVGADGLVEIKCPNTTAHIDSLLGGSMAIADKYRVQMLWQMACTGRQWCDFVSFDPRMPERLRVRIDRVNRDDKEIAELEKLVTAFLAELADKLTRLRTYGAPSHLKADMQQSIISAG